MVMEIPGFYYDEAKKKYFKIENNSSNHQYNSRSLKHKREEEQINSKISKLKLDRLQPLPFIQSKILNIRNKYSYIYPNQVEKDHTKYIFSSLELKNQNQRLIDLNSDSTIRTKTNRINVYGNNSIDEVVYISQGLNIFAYSREMGDDQLKLLLGNYNSLSSNFRLTSTSMSYHNILYTTYVDITTGRSVLYNLEYDFESMDFYTRIQHYLEIPEFLYGCKANEDNDIIIFGNESIRHFMPDRGIITSVKTNGIDALSLDIADYVNYIGFRNGSIKLWDIRTNKLKSIESNFKTSIINLEMINEHDIVISNIGSTIGLYDRRMGFETPKIGYNSIRKVEDIFDESIKPIDTEKFLISNKHSTEIFDIYESNALKTISTFNNPISGSHYSRVLDDKIPLYLFRGQNYDSYNL